MYRLRFLRLIFSCLFGKLQSLTSIFETRFFVIPFFDTDVLRMFTHTYSSYMALARWHCTFSSELRNTVLKYKCIPITIAETIDYKRSIKAFSRVKLTTRVLCWNEKSFYLEHQFLVNGDVYAIGFAEGLLRAPDGVKRPADIFKLAGMEQTSPDFPPEIISWISSLQKENRR